ncbi:MAG: type IV-A pilus assembly ATPase PilB, partial [Gammaproteobacteria bacterium]|nr:type IV-A pilus assembly ATPase PilB [Gammaproteobacteria bacterium]
MSPLINNTQSGLARSLAASALLTADQLAQAIALTRQEGKSLSTVLVEHQLLTSIQLAHFCEQEYGLPLTDLDDIAPEQIPPQFLSMDLIERHHVVPIMLQGKVLYLAMSDPTDVSALEDFGFRFNLVTDAILVEEDKLQLLLAHLQQAGDTLDLDHIEDTDIADLELGEDPAERHNDELGNADDDAPIVRYINKVILDAVRREASDLHFEPYERFYRIRFRIDGMLHEIASPPVN